MIRSAYSAGAFLETQITSYLKLRVAGGYQNIDFDNTGLVNDSHDSERLLCERVALPPRQFRAHPQPFRGARDPAGHQFQLRDVELCSAHRELEHSLSHACFRRSCFTRTRTIPAAAGIFAPGPGVPLFNPFVAEHIHRYGGALSLGYQLTPHVTLGLRYQYTQKDSDQPLRDYRQNRVSFDGTYSF